MDKIISLSSFLRFPRSELSPRITGDIFPLFQTHLTSDSQLFIAVSMGCDSLTLACLITHRRNQLFLPLDNLHFIHCNHKIRAESEAEEHSFINFFSGFDTHVFHRDTSLGTTESQLRDWRYQCFRDTINSTPKAILCLGHTLNDRIETTFLNLMRGCSRDGFFNMQILEPHHLLNTTSLGAYAQSRVAVKSQHSAFHPLLNTPKQQILDFCLSFGLPFVTDQTNFDPLVSKRNFIRQNIVDNLVDTNFFSSMKNLYSSISLPSCLEKPTDPKISLLTQIPAHPTRPIISAHQTSIPSNTSDIANLFKSFRLTHNLRKSQLTERLSRFQSSSSGWKQLQNTLFFKHLDKLIILEMLMETPARHALGVVWRENHLPDSLHISSLGEYSIGGLKITIDKKSWLGATLRYPQQGDSFAGKTWHRRCLNQKIPLIWRNFIPLVVRDGKILHMFKEVSHI